MKFLFPDTPGTPTGGGSPPVSAEPKAEPAAGISLSKEEYDKLRSAAEKAATLEQKTKQLEEDWGHTQKLLRQGGDPAEQEASIRHVLKRAGYSDAEVQQYLESQAGGDQDEPREEPRPRTRQRREETGGDQELRQEIEGLKKTAAEQEYRRLAGMMESTIGRTLDSHKETASLIKDMVVLKGMNDDKFNPEDYRSELLGTLREEIEQAAKKGIAQRRAEAVRLTRNPDAWSDSWIAEEAAKAAVAVSSKYRKNLPDVNKLGPTSHEATSEHFILNRKPVEPPTFKRGMDTSDAQAKARAWAADHLMRTVAEIDTGGKTKT